MGWWILAKHRWILGGTETQEWSKGAEEHKRGQNSTSITGYVYRGDRQILSYGLNSDSNNNSNYRKITSFNLLDVQGNVVGADFNQAGQSVATGTRQQTTWQINNLDGSKFTDSSGWFTNEFAFAGQKIASTNTDYLIRSRDSNRGLWVGHAESWGAHFGEDYAHYFNPANSWNDGSVSGKFFGGAQYVGWTAAAGAGIALGAIGAAAGLGAFGISSTYAGYAGAGLALTGAASSATSTYINNPNASYGEYGLAVTFGGLNPLGGMSGLAVGGGFAGVTALAGGDSAAAKRAFMAGDLIGGIFGGGADDVLKAIGKGAKFAYAMDHARRFARFQAGGAAIGWANGGVDGALMGANLGSMAGGIFANFAVACFTAGTPLVVDLDGSSRPIEEIEVGEFVLARSEFDPEGPLELKRVEEKFVRTAVVMELVIEGQSIKTTAEHPFYVPARQAFVPAGELKAGDKLVSHDGRLIEIASVCSTEAVATVYNLRVADHHTYFVGGSVWGWDVWVHNASRNYMLAVEEMLEEGSLSVQKAIKHPQHHVFPQNAKSKAWFKARGLDVHDYAVNMYQGQHGALHGGGNWILGKTWKKEWNNEIMRRLTTAEKVQLKAGGSTLTVEQIEKIGRKMMKDYGINDLPFVRYKRGWLPE